MKTLTFGDIHGERFWEKYDFSKYEKVVFLGDYVDDDDGWIPDVDIIENLEAIIAKKKAQPEKIVLLLGNHDLGYVFWPDREYSCTRMRSSYADRLNTIFTENLSLFQVAYEFGGVLWTHAGVCEQWFNYMRPFFGARDGGYADGLNNIFRTPERGLLKMIGPSRNGFDSCGGIFWADFSEFWGAPVGKWVKQIVGHNRMPSIRDAGWIVFCDVHSTQKIGFELEVKEG